VQVSGVCLERREKTICGDRNPRGFSHVSREGGVGSQWIDGSSETKIFLSNQNRKFVGRSICNRYAENRGRRKVGREAGDAGPERKSADD